MTEKSPFGNLWDGLGGTLFSRCFWYNIVSVFTFCLTYQFSLMSNCSQPSSRGRLMHLN